MQSKTVLITGASRGIGREIAVTFAHAGYRIAANYYSSAAQAEALQADILRLGGDCRLFPADVSSREEVLAMIDAIRRAFGTIDILVNNAGIGQQKLFTEITPEEWGRMLRVNLDSVFHCCQGVLPDMIRRKEGCIINISSMWEQVGASCEVHYSAAKAAVIGLTRALAKEVAPSGIRVNCIAPGFIDTEMNASLSPTDRAIVLEEIPLGRSGSPADVAEAARFLASPSARFITGQVLGVNGGMVI